jgi:hypothetical protein
VGPNLCSFLGLWDRSKFRNMVQGLKRTCSDPNLVKDCATCVLSLLLKLHWTKNSRSYFGKFNFYRNLTSSRSISWTSRIICVKVSLRCCHLSPNKQGHSISFNMKQIPGFPLSSWISRSSGTYVKKDALTSTSIGFWYFPSGKC